MEYSPVLCGPSFDLGSLPVRHWELAYFFESLLPHLSPPFFFCLVQHLTPDADSSHAQIPIELLDGIKEGLIVRRKQDVRGVLGVEGKPIRHSHRTWVCHEASAPLVWPSHRDSWSTSVNNTKTREYFVRQLCKDL